MNLFDSQEEVKFEINLDSELLENLGMSQEEKLGEVLKAGIKAAQRGNKTEARRLLLYVVNVQPDNEPAWMWLASVSEYPEELLYFLKNVLRINPSNQKALEWQKTTCALMAKTFVQRGINAYKEDRKGLARQFFEEALKHDEENELAWLWLASVTDEEQEKISFLERVLQINPENETARDSLEKIRQQKARELLKQANAAVIAGKGREAYKILEELMSLDSQIEEAWLLRAYLANSYEEKLMCFEKVLSLNPNNEIAQTGVEALREMKEERKESQGEGSVVGFSSADLQAPQDILSSEAAEGMQEKEKELEEVSELPRQNEKILKEESEFSEETLGDKLEEVAKKEKVVDFKAENDVFETDEKIMSKIFSEKEQDEEEAIDQGRVILVVDDSQTVRKLISTKLKKSGYRVVEAASGLEALQKLNEVIPDLILLDITMPELDGYEVCKRIRSSEATRDIPVVMISGRDGFFDKVRGRMVGSSGYITKPFGPETIITTVESYLKTYQKS
ncbi:MAG: response regulator [Acidobacteriota bacterium]|nr:response regulator [Acidobacteriota bacterium]